MKQRIVTLAALVVAATAWAQAPHAYHDAHGEPAGHPAAAPGGRTVQVRMGDDMRFHPRRIEVRQGETVRFVVRNTGRLPHEFVLGTPAQLREHAAQMRAHPGMAHVDPATLQVPPGGSGELAWTFERPGTLSYACLVPGHYEAGMRGSLQVHRM